MPRDITQTPPKVHDTDKQFGKEVHRLLMLMVAFMVALFISLPVYAFYMEKRQAEAFNDGKTLWCKTSEDSKTPLIPVSKEKGFIYSESANAFIAPNEAFAISNGTDRCVY